MGKITRARASRAIESEVDNTDLRWWLAKEPHVPIFANVERLGAHANIRQQQDLFYACLYDDAELASLVAGGGAIVSDTPQTMTTNIVRRQVDLFTAKMVKNRPVPMALTTGGNYGEQRRAKALTKFFEGVLDSVGYWKTRMLRIRDAAIFGSGIARNYRVGRKLIHERKFPWEIRTGPIDAMHGHPRSIYIRHHVDRMVLMDRYPKHAAKIKLAESRTTEDTWDISLDRLHDVVLVEEAFHLPSGEPELIKSGSRKGEWDAKDGAWALTISNCTLEIGDYLRDYHGISKFDFSPPVIGWWGEGMVRQLAGLQYEVNSIGLRLQEQGFLTGSYVMIPAGSGVETDTLDNGALTVIRYEGQKPEWVTPAPWHPQFFDYYMKLRGSFAGDITGFSGMASRGEGPPPGVESGKAIRAFHDIGDENLIPAGREDERDAVDTAWQLFDLMEEIHEEAGEEGEKYIVQVEKRSDGRSAMEPIDYGKVRMDRDKFTLRTFPTSFLASTPEDRWSQVSEMAEKGLFSQDELVSLLDFPDVQRVLNLRGSPRRVVERIIELFLDPDTDPPIIAPEPSMNLDIVVALGTLAYLEAKWIDEVPEKHTAPLLDFVLAAKELRDNPQQEETPAGQTPNDVAEGAMAANGGAGPQPGDQGPDAGPDAALGMPPGPGPDQGPLYAPPDAAPMPANAVAPEAMAPPGGTP
jgi:hypothetical protein